MTFDDLLRLLNESDENKANLSQDEYAALLAANAEAADEDSIDISLDIEEEPKEKDTEIDPVITAQQEELKKTQEGIAEAEKTRNDLTDIVKQKNTDIYNDIVNYREKYKVALNIPKGIDGTPDLSKDLIRKLKLPDAENDSLHAKFEDYKANKTELERATANLQILQQNAEEQQRRSQLSTAAAEYGKDVSDLERFVKPRGLQSKKEVSSPFSSTAEPETAASIAAVLRQARLEAEETVAEREIRLGAGKDPFAPGPKGITTSQMFNQGVSYKRITPTDQYYDSSRYIYDAKKGKLVPVSKAKAINIPKKVGEVFFELVKSDTSFSQQYKDALDDVFKDYINLYNKITANVNTIKIGRGRVEYLENRLENAQNTMVANAVSRISDAEAQTAQLPEQLEAKRKQYITRKQAGASADELEILKSEFKYIERQIADASEKSPKMRGKARSVFSERNRIQKLVEKAANEHKKAEEEYDKQKAVTAALREKLKDSTKSEAELKVIDSALQQQGKVEIQFLNAFNKKLEEYKKVREDFLKNEKRISNYEQELLRRELTVVGNPTAKKRPKPEEPTVYNSRQATSIAFELQRQKHLKKTFDGLVNSLKYGSVKLKEIKEEDSDRIITRNGEKVFPYDIGGGEIRYAKVVIKLDRRKEEVPWQIVDYVKGLYGYGGRPGYDEDDYEGVPIKGFGDNSGYYQTLEKSYKVLEDISAEMDSKREQILEKIYKTLDEAVGYKFSLGVAAGARNPGLEAVKAWAGFKKVQRAEYKDDFSLRGFTTDPVVSLYNFYINAQQKKMRKEQFKSHRLTDIESQLMRAASSMPGGKRIPDNYAVAGQDARLHNAYKDARSRAVGAAKETGDKRFIDLVNKYFNERDLTKEEFAQQVKATANTPPPPPENVIPFTASTSSETLDVSKLDMDATEDPTHLMDKDTKIADSAPIMSDEEQKRIQAEDRYYEEETAQLNKLIEQGKSTTQVAAPTSSEDPDDEWVTDDDVPLN